MLDLSALKASIENLQSAQVESSAALTSVVTNEAAQVKTAIESLKSQIPSPEVQEQLDAMAASVNAITDAVTASTSALSTAIDAIVVPESSAPVE